MTVATSSKQEITDLVGAMQPLIDQMLDYTSSNEPRSETLARASLIESGVTYLRALTLVQQGNTLPLDDLNDLVALSASFVNDVSRCLPKPDKEKDMSVFDIFKRKEETASVAEEIKKINEEKPVTPLFKRDPKDYVERDEKVRHWLRFVKAECLDQGDEYLKQAIARPLTEQFAGTTSINVLDELGSIGGISEAVLTDAVVLAVSRADGTNRDLDRIKPSIMGVGYARD